MNDDRTPETTAAAAATPTTTATTATGIARRGVLGVGLAAGAGLLATTSAAAATRGGDARTYPGGRRLTTRQQAGQRVVWSYPGLTPPAALLDAIRAGLVGGVIFFGENIDKNDRSQLQKVCARLDQAQRESGVGYPLLLNTDQEGGVVQRVPGAPGISAKQVGLSVHPESTSRNQGTATALNLLDAGVVCNLAPVLDVYREAGNFDDQFGRSYSMDPQVCGTLGALSIEAQQRLGVVTTAKHFPGLGTAPAGANTDLGPVVLNASASELRSVDELPFRDAIRAKVDMIMASWATYPALDPDRPAGISPTIIRGELRERLGYRGVTVTDAIEAGALAAFGGTGERSVRAAEAGMDVILCSARDVAQGQEAVDALAAAMDDGTLDATDSQDALQRVIRLRRHLA